LQAISYLVDVFLKQMTANKNFMEVSLFLAYFPKLLAGPIERAEGFFKQLQTSQPITNTEINESLLRIFIGLSRKILISDSILRTFPQEIFTNPQPHSAVELIFWWVIFMLIIYNDFAGYTSIARGVSGLFGIKLSPNFEQPYFSTSYIDFWNRWHISLSNWLRDYVYLPISRTMLRKNPSGRYWPNLVVPPLLTMMVSGLWHGAALHFILWGVLNGLLQGLERVQKLRKGGPPPVNPTRWRQIIGILTVFIVLMVINIPFKLSVAESLAFWRGLLNWSLPEMLDIRLMYLPLLAASLSFFMDIVELPQKDETGFMRLPKYLRVFLLSSGMLLLFLATRQQASAPFIYQEF
jgi:alginate O-acetyltransferase complex protein AlgI